MTRVFALWLLLVLPLLAQEGSSTSSDLDGACALIKAGGLEEHLKYLASDELEGRCSGFPGNDKASEYVAKHFEKIGLKPIVESKDGEKSYFQPFKVGGRATRNCLGFVEGTDPKLKEEIVVIGAHHDHVGKKGQPNAGRMDNPRGDKDDTIWNGADDNGSGTVTVLEIARAFMEGKVRTRRSVLFMTFSGEEFGLLGSKHYVSKPALPLAQTVAMINLDMVGRNGDKKLDVGHVATADEWTDLIQKAAEAVGLAYKTTPLTPPYSDHASFASKNIPAIHFFSGFHEDYHRQTDHWNKIDYSNMEKIGKFGLRLLVSVANLDHRMEYKGRSGPASRRKIGIRFEELGEEEAKELKLPEGQGGVRITAVSEGSVAEECGLKEGDIIVELNGKSLPAPGAQTEFRKILRGVKDNTDVPIVVLRGGKRVELTAKWEK